MIGFVRAFSRLTFFITGTLFYVSRYLAKAIVVGNDLDRALRLRKEWFRKVHRFLGVHITTYGEQPVEAGLLVCNHRSYYDPLLTLSQILALPVGKTEIQSWPVIGYAAMVSGAVFVDRKTREGRDQARKEILKMLKKGYFVINYPEGTTHIEPQTIEFKRGLFRDAAKEQFILYPLVHEYQSDSNAWIGDDTFFRHFFECFSNKNIYVRMSYGPKIQGDDPEQLLQKSKQWIDAELLRLRKGWHLSEQGKV